MIHLLLFALVKVAAGMQALVSGNHCFAAHSHTAQRSRFSSSHFNARQTLGTTNSGYFLLREKGEERLLDFILEVHATMLNVSNVRT